jgi:tRNA(fMet)-specific endonuclease VapC
MTRCYLLDTGPAQDYQSNRGDVRERVIALRKQGDRVGICVPVLGELWSGVQGSASKERNLRSLLRAVSRLVVWPYTEQAAEEYGRIYAELRRSGRMIQQIDIQIGAIARTLPNCVIVSKDSDLTAIPGAKVENWAT